MESREYLLRFGLNGEFGRFRASATFAYRRGERVVIRGPRGVEIAEVLREAVPGHAQFLPNTSVGQLLRRLTAEDERTEGQMRDRGQQVFECGQRLLVELNLPFQLLDVEVLLDGQHAVLHYLSAGSADVRPFVSTLSREFELHVTLVDLAGQHEALEQEEHHGCGRPNCGQEEGDGCGSCGAGGCGSCSTAHFGQLRESMDHRRTALL
jgi:cell fate regulator YaaT (PSP1 superfamily)